MEVATPETVIGLRRSDSKSSSETLVTLSILQLIRFFDSLDPKSDDLDEVSEFDPLTPERCESFAGKRPKGEGNEDWKGSESESSAPTSKLIDDEKRLPLSSSGEDIASNAGSHSTCTAPNDSEQTERNFRPRDLGNINRNLGISDQSNTELPKDRMSRSFSIGSFHARQWMKSATILFRQNKKKKQESDVSHKENLLFPVHLAGPPAPLPQKSGRSATINPSKRMSSLFTHEHSSETNLENMMFLPKPHHPLPQNYRTVEEVEDIADAQTEYSVPPEEWIGYMDLSMKAAPVKSKWEKWRFSIKMKKLRKKLKSGFASGTHKTHTFRVRFLKPGESREPAVSLCEEGKK